jgi:pyridinium-3,5-biscarboxylic acid mononucleotide sulfurtransferase
MLMSASKLADFFSKQRNALVSFSGGVDSSVLAKAAYDALGADALAVTFDTPTLPRSELACAKKTAKKIGIRHLIVPYSELGSRQFRSNPKDRCYFCKKRMAQKLKEVAKEHGMGCIVEGTNAEDLKGHRPGYRALKEAGISSPLAELGFAKDDVRKLAKEYGLDYMKPSAACLSSRIPQGTEITKELLRTVEEAEDYLKSLGLTQVRVRLEGEGCLDARIEVCPEEFQKVIKHSSEIVDALSFRRVSLDLRGYS